MKKKIIITISILAAVFAVAGGLGIYNHQKKEQAAIAAEEKKEQEKLQKELKEYQTRLETLQAQSENLILTEEEQTVITEELQKAEETLDKKEIKQAKKTVESLEQKITEIETANAAMLTEKAGQVTDYHTEYYSTENQSVLDIMLTEYNDLFTAKAYQSANAKLDEILTQVVALKEEPQRKTTEVARTSSQQAKSSNKSTSSAAGSGTTIPEPYTEEYYDWLESVTGKTSGYTEDLGPVVAEGYTNGDGTGIHWEEFASKTEEYNLK